MSLHIAEQPYKLTNDTFIQQRTVSDVDSIHVHCSYRPTGGSRDPHFRQDIMPGDNQRESRRRHILFCQEILFTIFVLKNTLLLRINLLRRKGHDNLKSVDARAMSEHFYNITLYVLFVCQTHKTGTYH